MSKKSLSIVMGSAAIVFGASMGLSREARAGETAAWYHCTEVDTNEDCITCKRENCGTNHLYCCWLNNEE